MKKLIKLLCIAGLAIVSCKKENTVNEPVFDVSVRTNTVKVREPVTFYLSGNPDLISFWSGEKTHIYSNNSVNSERGVKQWVQFETQVGAGTQTNNLKLMASKDFSGVYDAENIAKATWTDISNRVNWATSTTRVGTGQIDLLDFSTAENNTPVYLAFYYYSPKNDLKPRRWTIVNLQVHNVLANGITTTFAPTLLSALFKDVDLKNPTYNWSITSGMVMNDGPIGTDENENWAISGPIDLNRVGTADFANTSDGLLKGISDAPVQEFSYNFAAAGKYTVTFEASNVSINEKKTVVRNIDITVEP
ncbi:MAG: DUF5017 domain-containing protein [Sphingobacteriales bacterium]|nr:MAG: DUF5017 domain-containing protein [Sphingobacteriales bacterium]